MLFDPIKEFARADFGIAELRAARMLLPKGAHAFLQIRIFVSPFHLGTTSGWQALDSQYKLDSGVFRLSRLRTRAEMLATRRPGCLRSNMLTFQISGYLTEFTGGRAEVKIEREAATVGEALNQLWAAHSGLRDRVLLEKGEGGPHVNVFVNSDVVARDRVLQTNIDGSADICIMPAVSGGAGVVSLGTSRD